MRLNSIHAPRYYDYLPGLRMVDTFFGKKGMGRGAITILG